MVSPEPRRCGSTARHSKRRISLVDVTGRFRWTRVRLPPSPPDDEGALLPSKGAGRLRVLGLSAGRPAPGPRGRTRRRPTPGLRLRYRAAAAASSRNRPDQLAQLLGGRGQLLGLAVDLLDLRRHLLGRGGDLLGRRPFSSDDARRSTRRRGSPRRPGPPSPRSPPCSPRRPRLMLVHRLDDAARAAGHLAGRPPRSRRPGRPSPRPPRRISPSAAPGLVGLRGALARPSTGPCSIASTASRVPAWTLPDQLGDRLGLALASARPACGPRRPRPRSRGRARRPGPPRWRR